MAGSSSPLSPAGLSWTALVFAAALDTSGIPAGVLTSPAACGYIVGAPSVGQHSSGRHSSEGADGEQNLVRSAYANLERLGETVTVTGDGRVPASGMLFIGRPEGQNVAPGPLDSSSVAKATVNLLKPISNGLSYNFTFTFEKAGQGSVSVPISAGLAPQQG